jgi:hypothetical protein
VAFAPDGVTRDGVTLPPSACNARMPDWDVKNEPPAPALLCKIPRAPWLTIPSRRVLGGSNAVSHDGPRWLFLRFVFVIFGGETDRYQDEIGRGD